MKKNIRNRKYSIKEAVSYYILGYRKFEQNKKDNELGDILKDILEVANENADNSEIQEVNTKLLKDINFKWVLSADDFIAYATCIFYILLNRKIQITDENIVEEFLNEIYSHHPIKTMKQAEIILDDLIMRR